MFYQVEMLRDGLWRIWDVSHTAFYLVEGRKHAALIDSGVGVGSVKEIVETLTKKPVSVWLTHGHVDHAMGAGEFEEIHMNSADIPVFQLHSAPKVRRGYVSGSAIAGGDPSMLKEVRDEDYLPVPKEEDFLPILSDQRLDLGGVHLHFFDAAGHTPGCMAVLLEEWCLLILGDACNGFTYLFDPWCPTVERYRKNLERLREQTSGKYDRLLFHHGNGEGAKNMIDSVIAVCDDILSGRSDEMPFRGPNGESAVIAKAMDFQRFCRADGGEGNIIYRPDFIR